MANPNTIFLADGDNEVNDLVAGEAITPGHLIEVYAASAGVNKWRKNSSATEYAALAVALDQPELNMGVDDAYAAADKVRARFLDAGDVFWGLVPSGQTIANGDLLQSNGDGTLKKATATTADANLGRLQALDNLGAVTTLTRCRVQVIG